MTDHDVKLAIIELTEAITELGDLVLAKKPDVFWYRRKRNGHLGAINRLLGQPTTKVDDLPSSSELHDRLVELELSEAERQRDKDRPVHVTIKRS